MRGNERRNSIHVLVWCSKALHSAGVTADGVLAWFIARCRDTMTILPAITTIERLCADALVAAERNIEKHPNMALR